MQANDTTKPAEDDEEEYQKYNLNLRGDVHVEVREAPYMRKEWHKIMNGDPVEINPSFGHGYKIMTVDEWAKRWKRNDRFPDCLACGATNTKEHHFVQTWCRGKKKWQSEIMCLGCHMFTWRSYKDPDFLTPEEYEKQRWEKMVDEHKADKEKAALEGKEMPEMPEA